MVICVAVWSGCVHIHCDRCRRLQSLQPVDLESPPVSPRLALQLGPLEAETWSWPAANSRAKNESVRADQRPSPQRASNLYSRAALSLRDIMPASNFKFSGGHIKRKTKRNHKINVSNNIEVSILSFQHLISIKTERDSLTFCFFLCTKFQNLVCGLHFQHVCLDQPVICVQQPHGASDQLSWMVQF